jgi:Cellulase (glycosyl hydrolase family 5)
MQRRRFIQQLGAVGAATWLAANTNMLRAADNKSASSGLIVHPDNPRYFLFRGRPLVLLAASEHYGSIINRRFDFARYLHDAAARKQTVTRTFAMYRELQSARNPYSPLKAESPDYVTPWPRTGPGRARDGELKFDLDQWNPEYFERLHRFLSLASELGIVVELTLLSNTYSDDCWDLNPLRGGNNIQGVGDVKWQEYISQRDKKLFERQVAHVRKIAQETSKYDNVYYEICNEPGGGFPNEPSPAEVDEWQVTIARVLRVEMSKLGRVHLVSGQNAFAYQPEFSQGFDASYAGTMLDIVNVHPLPHLMFKGHQYELGNFMSKELQLTEFRDFFLATSKESKPTISDEDNDASMYVDETGWTVHRKRAWVAVMCGAHYDFIDFSIQSHLEGGTTESQNKIRNWIRNLSQFISKFDFIHANTAQDWIRSVPEHTVGAGLAMPGRDYVAYVADSREITDAAAGSPVNGELALSLPAGDYSAQFYSPVSGEKIESRKIKGGEVSIRLNAFQQDVALRITAAR